VPARETLAKGVERGRADVAEDDAERRDANRQEAPFPGVFSAAALVQTFLLSPRAG
jgi:hypothetical protein